MKKDDERFTDEPVELDEEEEKFVLKSLLVMAMGKFVEEKMGKTVNEIVRTAKEKGIDIGIEYIPEDEIH